MFEWNLLSVNQAECYQNQTRV